VRRKSRSVAINALNHAKLRIDRMTGDIAITGGFSEFSGKCEAIHADDKPKFWSRTRCQFQVPDAYRCDQE